MKCKYTNTKFTGIIGLAVIVLSSPLGAQTTITTIPAWDGASSVNSWGIPNTATYGQTITAPTDNVLTSFTFELNVPAGIPYTADVYAWDGNEASGPALYTSPTLTTTNVGGFGAVTINTPDVALTTGDQYVLFFTTSGLQAGQPDNAGIWGQPQNQDIYSGGAFVFINSGDGPNQLTSTAWSQGFLGPGADLAFSATFQSAGTPEPGSVALLVGLGIAGSGIGMRKRRSKDISA